MSIFITIIPIKKYIDVICIIIIAQNAELLHKILSPTCVIASSKFIRVDSSLRGSSESVHVEFQVYST